MRVFLGGTVNDSKWRDIVMPRLDIDYFNPVVEEWNDQAYERELYERRICDYVLYVLTPKFTGYYAIAEVTDDSFKRPDRTIYCFLEKDQEDVFTPEQKHTFEKLGKLVSKNGAKCLNTLDEIVDFLNSAKKLDTSNFDKKDYNDIFISYGREYSYKFTQKINDSLTQKNYSVWLDSNDIPLGIDYPEQVKNAIKRSHHFVFVISPHAVRSEYCKRELEWALEYQKSIIPILHVEPVDDWKDLHPEIEKRKWIYFQENINPYDDAFNKIEDKINKHFDYVKIHTKTLDLSLQWDAEERSSGMLLVGPDRKEAQEWLQKKIQNAPWICSPLPLQAEFITESKKSAANYACDIFIAYHKSDETNALKVHQALVLKGITTWIEKVNLRKNDIYQQAIEKAIERSSHFLFLISEQAVHDENMKNELEYAVKLHKNLIPYEIEEIDYGHLPAEIRLVPTIEYHNRNFTGTIKRLITLMQKEEIYYNEHRDVLVKALNWERKNFPENELLYGFDLGNAEEWLQKNKDRGHNAPLEIQEKLIIKSRSSRISVFISYGRRESLNFATRLHNRLVQKGFDVWFDQNDIPLGVDFQEQIDRGIEKADNFLFVIAPHSVKSVYCLKEILLAIKYGKRIIPLLHIDEAENFNHMHKIIQKINWIYFREEKIADKPLHEWPAIDDFENAFQGLVNLLYTHHEYVSLHTKLLIKANEWDKNQRKTHFLLVGKNRMKAEEWLLTKFDQNIQQPCFPNELQCEFITESKKNAHNLQTDVFISYAIENSDAREKIRKSLARYNISTWVHSRDIDLGTNFEDAIKKGIAEANCTLYFISKEAVESEYCQIELEYAQKLNKKIIPILIQEVPKEKIPQEIEKLQYIDFSTVNFNKELNQKGNEYQDNTALEDGKRSLKTPYEKSFDILLNELENDKEYFDQHKIILTQALKWEKQQKNQSLLLRGYNLEKAITWIQISKNKSYKPTELQIEFITESENKTGMLGTEVFISYSRSDGDFARKFNEALQLNGKTTWFDQESIAVAADFQQEIYNGIRNSDNFVFLISPDSVESPYCADEVEFARKNNKRFITALITPTPVSLIHPELAKIQWIDFHRQEFNTAFSELLRSLDIDRAYVQNHTKWLQQALLWQKNKYDEALLLRGNEFALAEEWFNNAVKTNKTPPPTELQEKYINKSRKALLIERKKKKRNSIFLKVLAILSFIGLVASLILTFTTEKAKDEAEMQKIVAVVQKTIAEKEKDKAEKNLKTVQEQRNKLDSLSRNLAESITTLQNKEKELKRAYQAAINAKDEAKAQQIKAEQNELRAEIEAKVNKITYLALNMAKTDPTFALKIADKARELSDRPIANKLFNDIYFENNNFYNTQISQDEPINVVKITPNGKYIITSTNKNITVWDSKGNKQTSINDPFITKLKVSADGNYFLTSIDNEYGWKLRDLNGNTIKEFKGKNVLLAPYNQRFAEIFNYKIDIFDANLNKIDDFQTNTGDKISFTPAGNYFHVVFNASKYSTIEKVLDLKGKIIYKTENNTLLFSNDDKYMIVFDNSKAQLCNLQGDTLFEIRSTWPISNINFTPKSNSFYYYSNNIVTLWSTENKYLGQYIDENYNPRLIKFSDNLEYVFTGTRLYNKNGELIIDFKLDATKNYEFCFAPDNKYFALWDEQNLEVFNINGQKMKSINVAPYTFNKVIFLPNGEELLTATNNRVFIWSFEDSKLFKQIQTQENIINADITFNSKFFLTSHKEKVLLWSNTGKQIYEYPIKKSIKNKAEFHHHSYKLVTASTIEKGKNKIAFSKPQNIGNQFEIDMDGFIMLDISSDDKYTMIYNLDTSINIYYTQTGNLFKSFSTKSKIVRSCFTPKAKYIFTSFNNGINLIRELDLDTVFLFKTKHPISQIKFSNDNNYIICGQNDIVELRAMKGNVIRKYEGHTGRITSIDISEDERYILSGGTDQQAILWDLEGAKIKTFNCDNEIVTVKFSKNNDFIFIATTKEVLFWHTPSSFIQSGVFPKYSNIDYLHIGFDIPIEELMATNDYSELIEPAKYYNYEAVSEKDSIQKKYYRYAKSLYLKADSIAPSIESRIGLLEVSNKLEEPYNLSELLNIKSSEQVIEYIDYIFEILKRPTESTKNKIQWQSLDSLYFASIKIIPDANNVKTYYYEKLMKKGDEYFKVTDYANAVEYYKRAASVKEHESEPLKKLASSYYYLKNYTEAYQTSKKMVEVNPKDYTLWWNLSWFSLFEKDYKTGIKAGQKVIELEPDKIGIYTNLALNYILNNEYDKAAEIYQKMKDQPNNYGKMRDLFLEDIETLENAGIKHPDFEKAKIILNTGNIQQQQQQPSPPQR